MIYLTKKFGEMTVSSSGDDKDTFGDAIQFDDQGSSCLLMLTGDRSNKTNLVCVSVTLFSPGLGMLIKKESGECSLKLDKANKILGICFGERVDQQGANVKLQNDSLFSYNYVPPKKLDGFSSYITTATPKTKKVFGVCAISVQSSKDDYDRRAYSIKRGVKDVLGIKFDKASSSKCCEEEIADYTDESGMVRRFSISRQEADDGKIYLVLSIFDRAYQALNKYEHQDSILK